MGSLIAEARKASRDSDECRKTIEKLRSMGFSDAAFRLLHPDSMNGFYSYSTGVKRFRKDETNRRVHQRLMYVLLSYRDDALSRGRSFEALAKDARSLI